MKYFTDENGILIAGLGNQLLKDDGVGVHVANELKKHKIDGAVVVDVGTSINNSLEIFQEAKTVIFIDAMEAGYFPGTVYQLKKRAHKNKNDVSAMHESSIIESLRLIRQDEMPEIHVIGVEPRDIELGIDLSEPVKESIPKICNQVRRLAEELKNAANF